MKIVVLDGHTMNPGDLDATELLALGPCEVYERTTPEHVLERCAGTQIVLTNKTVLTAEHFLQLPQLRYIGVLATGTNVVDLAAAHRHGIVVTNVPAYSTPSVVQMVFALLLELTQQVGLHNKLVQQGQWRDCVDFSFSATPLIELQDKTLGLIGYGHIGRKVAAVARAFGMKVLVHTRTPGDDQSEGVRFVDLQTLIADSDVLSLHCPLTETTRHLMNADTLSQMRSSAYLINTGRGPLVDETALAAALNAGQLAGAGVDVLSEEPPRQDSPLIGAKNCLVTPHIAWATQAARQRLLNTAVKNVQAFLRGEPVNQVN
jgi:glycerate dehydrogenase